MIEANNPEINVDELMQKIQEEVARRNNLAVPESANSNFVNITPANLMNLNQIEALLNNAELKSQVRTEIPPKFNRFPFKVSKGLQKFALKLYSFLFKEQRAVNFSLIQALKESLTLNRHLSEQLYAIQAQMKTTSERLQAVDERLQAVDDRYIKNDSYLKNDLAQQKRLITLFLEEARQRLPEPFASEQLQTFVNENQHLLDAFYVAFEDRFRGRRDDIVERLKFYLPRIAQAQVGTQDFPILDLGCGRGEWLELLRDAGCIAKGLDINRVMLDQCQARGLEVIESDVIAYLTSLPDASLGAVTGFHIIEHLPFPLLMKLFNETLRVLKPGGLAIFETPNPQNLLVGSNNFYLDPSHLHPLPSLLSEFLLEHIGFYPVEIVDLNPNQDSCPDNGSKLAELVNNYFYGPQDYAVIGYKV